MNTYLTGMAIDVNGKEATTATFDRSLSPPAWVFESLLLGTHVVLGYTPQTRERLSDELEAYHASSIRVLQRRRELAAAERAVLRWRSRHDPRRSNG